MTATDISGRTSTTTYLTLITGNPGSGGKAIAYNEVPRITDIQGNLGVVQWKECTMSNEKYQPTKEDLERWERLDELGMTAMFGTPMSQEEKDRRIQSVIDGSCFNKYLEGILQRKQRLLDKLAATEKTEKLLRDKIAQMEARKKQK